MTGLEKIISQIESESNDRCRSIKAQAENKAQDIISEAEAQAKQIAEESTAATLKKVDNINQSAVSSAELNKSKIILKAKLEAIDDMLNKSLEAIKALPVEEYFDLLASLIVSNAKEGEGTLCLNEDDLKRMPAAFVEDVNNKLGERKKLVKGNAIEIESGFVLVYGDIDINCSFDAIAASKRDELRDALNALLFN